MDALVSAGAAGPLFLDAIGIFLLYYFKWAAQSNALAHLMPMKGFNRS